MPREALITCEFHFEASHQLRREDWSDAQNERVFGNCARVHGHSYRFLVTLRGPIDPDTGMVMNFRDVKRAVDERVVRRMDHHHLNDLLPELTTAENLVYWMARQLLPDFGGALYRIELWETRYACAALEEAQLRALMEGQPRPVVV